MYKILTEASGSLTAAYLIKAIQQAGYAALASDIDSNCAGRFLADEYICMPSINEPHLWEIVTDLLIKHHVNMVIPSLDETLIGWALRKKNLVD